MKTPPPVGPVRVVSLRRRLGLFVGMGLMLAVPGCGTSGQDYTAGLREKVQGPDYRTTLLEDRQQGEVFTAAVAALENMGFRVTRSRAAAGVIEGMSGLRSDDALIGSHQRAVYVRLRQNLDAVRVEVRFTEIVEESFAKGPGRATENTLRDTPLHEVFLREVGKPPASPET